MIVKQFRGCVFGAELTNKEKKALEIEARKAFAEMDKKNIHELDAMILLLLHEEFGFGKERLKKVYTEFDKKMRDLVQRYEVESCDVPFVCTQRLKAYGIDLEEWFNEVEQVEQT